MTIKWMVQRWDKEPRQIEVTKETAHFVTYVAFPISGGRHDTRRIQKYGVVFDTWDEARESMMGAARRAVTHAEARWQRAKAELRRISQLKKPKESEGE